MCCTSTSVILHLARHLALLSLMVITLIISKTNSETLNLRLSFFPHVSVKFCVLVEKNSHRNTETLNPHGIVCAYFREILCYCFSGKKK